MMLTPNNSDQCFGGERQVREGTFEDMEILLGEDEVRCTLFRGEVLVDQGGDDEGLVDKGLVGVLVEDLELVERDCHRGHCCAL